jgi:predicted nucleotidyltransferase
MTLLDRARLRQELENRLQLPVDLVVQARGTCPRPFQRIALARAVPLGTPR